MLGGGGKKQQPASAIPAARAAIIPPPVATATEVVNAQKKARLGLALRTGYGRRSIAAGETASGTAYQNPAGGVRTLGGGP